MQSPLIRFDWAMKRLLRQKSNFVILEGFLSVLLKDSIKIEQILESEANQESYDDKFNKVDILAQNGQNELIIVEVQNTKQLDYFQRMLYGVSKVTSEYLNLGEPYSQIKKRNAARMYSGNIVYFDLGQGKDYVYHGKTEFVGIHQGDKLTLSEKQKELFDRNDLYQLFPEYYVLKINNFDDLAHDNLDEWLYYLKHNEVPQDAQAQGLKEVAEYLKVQQLNKAEQGDYYRHLENDRLAVSLLDTARIEGRSEGEMKGKIETAKNLKRLGLLTNEQIAQATGLSVEEVQKLL